MSRFAPFVSSEIATGPRGGKRKVYRAGVAVHNGNVNAPISGWTRIPGQSVYTARFEARAAAGHLTAGCEAAQAIGGFLRAFAPADNWSERIALGSLISEITGEDYVSTTEAARVVEWCREWVADTFSDPTDIPGADDGSRLSNEVLLRGCEHHIDGGLSFVLADVRATGATIEEIRHEEREEAQTIGNVPVTDYSAEGIATMRAHLAILGEASDIDVARLHSGTEDGPLWYVTRHGVKGDGGWMYEADALRDAILTAREGLPKSRLTVAEAREARIAEEAAIYDREGAGTFVVADDLRATRAVCAFLRHYGNLPTPDNGPGCEGPEKGAYVVQAWNGRTWRKVRGGDGGPWSTRDRAERVADAREDLPRRASSTEGMPHRVVSVTPEPRESGAYGPTFDASAARLAQEAADAFEPTPGDGEDTARRAGDILADLPAASVPAFLARLDSNTLDTLADVPSATLELVRHEENIPRHVHREIEARYISEDAAVGLSSDKLDPRETGGSFPGWTWRDPMSPVRYGLLGAARVAPDAVRTLRTLALAVYVESWALNLPDNPIGGKASIGVDFQGIGGTVGLCGWIAADGKLTIGQA